VARFTLIELRYSEVCGGVNKSCDQVNLLNAACPGCNMYGPPQEMTGLALLLVFHFVQEQTPRRSFHAGPSAVPGIEKCSKGLG
jgi:hypothetical protein